MKIDNEVMQWADEKMNKTIDALHNELSNLRAGRANPNLLKKIQVEYYGTMTPLAQMANIAAPEPRVLTISLFDATALKATEKAIIGSDLGITPSNDGKLIRIVFPELTAERRKELVKQAKKFAEECKVSIRSVRRDVNEKLKKQKKDAIITEDDLTDLEKDIQKMTDEHIKSIDNILKEKEKEITEI